MKAKILLLGASGQLGVSLRFSLLGVGSFLFPSRKELDLHNEKAVKAYLEKHQPKIIINAAAYTQVDLAEDEPESAFSLNEKLPTLLADFCAKKEALLLHYSTDYVFQGLGQHFQKEDEHTNPNSVYGESKRRGEQAILQSGSKAYIIRLSWLFSIFGHNFLKTILSLASQKDSLSLVSDQIGAPVSASLVGAVSLEILERFQKNNPIPFGLYHLAPGGETSWFGYAVFLLTKAEEFGVSFQVPSTQIQPIVSSQYPSKVARPLNSRLNTEKLSSSLGVSFPSWEEGVLEVLNVLLSPKKLLKN